MGCLEFVSGGAVGFDLLAAELVLGLRELMPQVRLYMVLPCPEQDIKFSNEDKARYREVLARADKVRYISDRYFKGCMFMRNDTMAEMADYCICYLTNSKSGTGYTVSHAAAKGAEIINLAEIM